ncbi:hypothetical protein BG004_000991, partial [Podila humilis]
MPPILSLSSSRTYATHWRWAVMTLITTAMTLTSALSIPTTPNALAASDHHHHSHSPSQPPTLSQDSRSFSSGGMMGTQASPSDDMRFMKREASATQKAKKPSGSPRRPPPPPPPVHPDISNTKPRNAKQQAHSPPPPPSPSYSSPPPKAHKKKEDPAVVVSSHTLGPNTTDPVSSSSSKSSLSYLPNNDKSDNRPPIRESSSSSSTDIKIIILVILGSLGGLACCFCCLLGASRLGYQNRLLRHRTEGIVFEQVSIGGKKIGMPKPMVRQDEDEEENNNNNYNNHDYNGDDGDGNSSVTGLLTPFQKQQKQQQQQRLISSNKKGRSHSGGDKGGLTRGNQGLSNFTEFWNVPLTTKTKSTSTSTVTPATAIQNERHDIAKQSKNKEPKTTFDRKESLTIAMGGPADSDAGSGSGVAHHITSPMEYHPPQRMYDCPGSPTIYYTPEFVFNDMNMNKSRDTGVLNEIESLPMTPLSSVSVGGSLSKSKRVPGMENKNNYNQQSSIQGSRHSPTFSSHPDGGCSPLPHARQRLHDQPSPKPHPIVTTSNSTSSSSSGTSQKGSSYDYNRYYNSHHYGSVSGKSPKIPVSPPFCSSTNGNGIGNANKKVADE